MNYHRNIQQNVLPPSNFCNTYLFVLNILDYTPDRAFKHFCRFITVNEVLET